MTDPPGRAWGYWTRGKLDVLRRYLDAFTTASKNVSERIYLDLFAGDPQNIERFTGELMEGSARLALTTGDPQFTRLRFFEMPPRAARLQDRISHDFPGRDAIVYEGDCNETIGRALAELQPWTWAPTFAFIDPNGPHFRWTTLESLAAFKRPGLTKVELWILFPAGLSTRVLPVDGSVRKSDAALLTGMFGTDHWTEIYRGRLEDLLTPREAREHYVNLMRWRLERDLGYRFSAELEILNEHGVSLYHMIFATDNGAGERIMMDLYRKAAGEFPRMRRQAREQRRQQEEHQAGIMRLPGLGEDLEADVRRGEQFYEHVAAVEPWRHPQGPVPGR
ncbi:MAG: three-Cys-motif partner protein TcmP [Candidatus Dormibacteria bacterium]